MLLEGAAILHDIGYLINYAAHHKHSYHLIVHADLPGLTTREVAVVANVARYHRLSEPKRDHPGYAKLSREDRRLVRALAGILRVADGLDRTHTQSVRAVDLRVEDACIVFGARCENECGVDIWGAERKASLFEKVFGLRTRFECNEAVPVVPVRDAAIAIAGTAVQPV
jgi:exopolyphosphatase/guanosine-5'-triphosphate,3'-diphosphate pyrophosphatase